MIAKFAWTVLLSCACAWPAIAGDTLSIRLVEAAQEGKGDSAGIEDVVEVLKKTLPAQSYKLVARAAVDLPAQNASARVGAYTVTCNTGKKNRLALVISSDRKEVLTTEITLKEGSPVVLVLSSTKKSTMVLVFKGE